MQELNELKNLVIQSLEANGSLSNIRAQIRASVFKVIDHSDNAPVGNTKKPSPFSWENPKCQKLLENEYGMLALQLIKEFLSFYSMDYSNSVFSSESNLREDVKRDKLNSQLLFSQPDPKKPLLLQLLEEFKTQKTDLSPAQKKPEERTDEKAAGNTINYVKAPINSQTVNAQQPTIQTNNNNPQKVNIISPTANQNENRLQNEQEYEEQENNSHVNYDYESDHEQHVEQDSADRKRALEEAHQCIQKNQNQMKSGQIASLPIYNSGQNKFSNQKPNDQAEDEFDYELDGVEEQLHQYNEVDLDMDDDLANSKSRHATNSGGVQNLFEDSEDYIGQSSKGHDISVDSYQLENYDYVTDVEDL